MEYTLEEIRSFFGVVLTIMVIIMGFVLLTYGAIVYSVVCFVFAGIALIFLYVRYTKYRCANCGHLTMAKWTVCPYCGHRLEHE